MFADRAHLAKVHYSRLNRGLFTAGLLLCTLGLWAQDAKKLLRFLSIQCPIKNARAGISFRKNKKGRGAAIRYGVEKARGRIVVFFPSDDEYEPRNIIDLARYIQTNEFEAVFGSRSIKCLNLDDRIRSIYRGKRWPYLISKYGGFSLSVLTLLLFNRFVIDPLTGLKAFDRRLLNKLDLKSNGVELETEIIARLSQAQKYILEVPVEYQPRLKSEGKKITIRDGLQALLNLLKMRFLDRR